MKDSYTLIQLNVSTISRENKSSNRSTFTGKKKNRL